MLMACTTESFVPITVHLPECFDFFLCSSMSVVMRAAHVYILSHCTVCVCVRLNVRTVQFGVQLAQVGGNSGDEDFHCCIGRADLKTCLIRQHGEN